MVQLHTHALGALEQHETEIKKNAEETKAVRTRVEQLSLQFNVAKADLEKAMVNGDRATRERVCASPSSCPLRTPLRLPLARAPSLAALTAARAPLRTV